MSLASSPALIRQPGLPAAPLRVILADGQPLTETLLTALRNGRSPVFVRWPDPTGGAIIGSARSATGAITLAADCGEPAMEFEPVQIEFEFHLAALPPIRILAEAWIPV